MTQRQSDTQEQNFDWSRLMAEPNCINFKFINCKNIKYLT